MTQVLGQKPPALPILDPRDVTIARLQYRLKGLEFAKRAGTKDRLNHLAQIEGRFFSWTLHEQQELDFAWIVKHLKKEWRR